MKTRTALKVLVAGAVLVGGGLVAATQTASALPGATATASVDSTLAGELSFARDEERMARDLYRALADRYDGALPFSRITLSEQQHFDAVGTLLTRYGVADPASGRKAGSYADPAIQQLYDGWLAEGSRSLAAAYGVGVALEKRDIADLEHTLHQTAPADVTRVLTALLNGSKHHLAAFQAAADGRVLGMQDGQGRLNGTGPGMGPGSGRGYGMGMRDGGPGAGGGGRQGFRNDCPMLDAS